MIKNKVCCSAISLSLRNTLLNYNLDNSRMSFDFFARKTCQVGQLVLIPKLGSSPDCSRVDVISGRKKNSLTTYWSVFTVLIHMPSTT